MILSRVIEHVKKQQWAGAFIELAIVILGVFIDLQSDHWNQTRGSALAALGGKASTGDKPA